MEKSTLEFQNKDLPAWLGSGLVAMGNDILNNEKITKADVIIMYLVSQRDNALLIQRILEDKKKRGIKFTEESLQKIQKFMNQNRFSPLLGCGWKEESEVIVYLLDVGLKLGKPFLDKICENYQSVTSTMPSLQFDNPEERNKKIEKELNENGR